MRYKNNQLIFKKYSSEKDTLIPKWQAITTAFTKVNHGMKSNKYVPHLGDPNPAVAPNPVEEFREKSVS